MAQHQRVDSPPATPPVTLAMDVSPQVSTNKINTESVRKGDRPQEPIPSTSTPSPDEARALLERADSLRRTGQYSKASQTLNRLIAEHPTHTLIPDALYAMGRLQIERGEQTAGRSTLLRLSRLYPSARAAVAAQKYLNGGGS